MKCKNCPAGRRTIRNEHRCVNCLLYGIVMKEDHECTRDGWRDFDRHVGTRTKEEGSRKHEIQNIQNDDGPEDPGPDE